MGYKEVLEQAVNVKQFKITPCLKVMEYVPCTIMDTLLQLNRRLPGKEFTRFLSAIVRSSFLIELTVPGAKTDSTKYRTRWCSELRDNSDIRYSSYEQCTQIFNKLILRISQLDSIELQILRDYCKNSLFEYELPIDYISREAKPFHIASNIGLFINKDTERCTKVRTLIQDSEFNPKAKIFHKILISKIKVKAYQTDRAQTGDHQTNREKRWEAHPDNFQFAFRRDCNAIEANLILQVCQFSGVDKKLVNNLKSVELLPQSFDFYRCPITGDIMHYADFEREILHRVHGKSAFQVGHLNPLKSGGKHEPKNIGWISEDGNRIQGNLSMKEVDNLLRRIYRNRPNLTI